MRLFLADGGFKETALEAFSQDETYLCILKIQELESFSEKAGLDAYFIRECKNLNAMKFESQDGYDCLSLNVPDDLDQLRTPQRVCIYFSQHLLIFVCDEIKAVKEMLKELESGRVKEAGLVKALQVFLDKLTYDDAGVLESIEEEISDIEESLIVKLKNDVVDSIITLRKKLLVLKRYYEQFLDIMEELEQNENELIDKKSLKYFRMITSRVDRLYHAVMNLRDYVTQVRETYQAQMDINLNSIMKLFTVVTSIFMPLTLLAGWYGMNLRMPEYNWVNGYPFVIALSLIITVLILVLFKKKKWFD